jgi:hypothetical protein
MDVIVTIEELLGLHQAPTQVQELPLFRQARLGRIRFLNLFKIHEKM